MAIKSTKKIYNFVKINTNLIKAMLQKFLSKLHNISIQPLLSQADPLSFISSIFYP